MYCPQACRPDPVVSRPRRPWQHAVSEFRPQVRSAEVVVCWLVLLVPRATMLPAISRPSDTSVAIGIRKIGGQLLEQAARRPLERGMRLGAKTALRRLRKGIDCNSRLPLLVHVLHTSNYKLQEHFSRCRVYSLESALSSHWLHWPADLIGKPCGIVTCRPASAAYAHVCLSVPLSPCLLFRKDVISLHGCQRLFFCRWRSPCRLLHPRPCQVNEQGWPWQACAEEIRAGEKINPSPELCHL